jgi:hypothetical protein
MSLFSSIEAGVEKLSQRAYEGPKRDQFERQPSERQEIVKAISQNSASTDQVQEALDFSLARRGANNRLELTPLGQSLLDGYPVVPLAS